MPASHCAARSAAWSPIRSLTIWSAAASSPARTARRAARSRRKALGTSVRGTLPSVRRGSVSHADRRHAAAARRGADDADGDRRGARNGNGSRPSAIAACPASRRRAAASSPARGIELRRISSARAGSPMLRAARAAASATSGSSGRGHKAVTVRTSAQRPPRIDSAMAGPGGGGATGINPAASPLADRPARGGGGGRRSDLPRRRRW